MNENKRNEAKELIKKGKWNLAVALIAKESNIPEDEAKKVATQIKEEWLNERAAEPAPETKKKGKAGKVILVIFLIAVLGGGGWFAYNHFIAEPAQYAIEEDDANVETEQVGTFNEGLDYFEFAPIESADGHYFVIRTTPTGKLYRVSKKTLDEEIENVNEVSSEVATPSTDNVCAGVAKSVKSLIDGGFYDYALTSDVTHIPDSITVDGITYKNSLGEAQHDDVYNYKSANISNSDDMYEYFKSRNLEISCGDIKVKKIAAEIPSEKELDEYSGVNFKVILDAEITTNHCDGESVFAPEGETDNMTIEVYGWHGKGMSFSIMEIIFK